MDTSQSGLIFPSPAGAEKSPLWWGWQWSWQLTIVCSFPSLSFRPWSGFAITASSQSLPLIQLHGRSGFTNHHCYHSNHYQHYHPHIQPSLDSIFNQIIILFLLGLPFCPSLSDTLWHGGSHWICLAGVTLDPIGSIKNLWIEKTFATYVFLMRIQSSRKN